MKKFLMSLLVIMMTAFVSVNLVSCGDDEEENANGQPGSIYGIVTELGTAEPVKAIGVELSKLEGLFISEDGDWDWTDEHLLLKTVTYDDGHFEFTDLDPGDYIIDITAEDYEIADGALCIVRVKSGHQARVDIQVENDEDGMKVYTLPAEVSNHKATLSGEYTYRMGVAPPNECGIVYASNNNPRNGGKVLKCKPNNGKISVITDYLEEGTYYFQAYAKTTYGTAYGDVRSFKINN